MTFTGILLLKDEHCIETKAKENSDGKLVVKYQKKNMLFMPVEKASSQEYFPGIKGESTFILCQDPKFVIRQESDVYNGFLPFPLNVRVYHSPILVVLCNQKDYGHLTLKMYKNILNNWIAKDNTWPFQLLKSHRDEEEYGTNTLSDDDQDDDDDADQFSEQSTFDQLSDGELDEVFVKPAKKKKHRNTLLKDDDSEDAEKSEEDDEEEEDEEHSDDEDDYDILGAAQTIYKEDTFCTEDDINCLEEVELSEEELEELANDMEMDDIDEIVDEYDIEDED